MPEHTANSYDYFTVSLLPGIGPRRGRDLLDHFASFDRLLHSGQKELMRIRGISTVMAMNLHQALCEEKRTSAMRRRTEHNAAMAEQHGIGFLTIADEDYPLRLKNIYDPPLYLFVHGSLLPKDYTAIGIVGTRNPSDYGRMQTERFCQSCCEHGVTVVSGLALGIDTVAHRSTLQHGGRTIAVLGSGLRRIYPGINRRLADQITDNGCVLSELPLEAKPDATNFPRRNRIISGLSHGLVVIESATSGGAMISATIALDQNKDVFALPGSVHNAMSSGPHDLIRRNVAHLVTGPEQVLKELGMKHNNSNVPEVPVQLSLLEQEIVQLLQTDAVHVDEIAASTGRPHAALLPDLLAMEFRGLVRQLPGKYFQLESSNGK